MFVVMDEALTATNRAEIAGDFWRTMIGREFGEDILRRRNFERRKGGT